MHALYLYKEKIDLALKARLDFFQHLQLPQSDAHRYLHDNKLM
jgi:hypothetical protein